MAELIGCLVMIGLMLVGFDALRGKKPNPLRKSDDRQHGSSPMDDVYRDPVGVPLDDDHPAQTAAQLFGLGVMEPAWEHMLFG